MATDLSKVAKEKKIQYFLISFVDLFGVFANYSNGRPTEIAIAIRFSLRCQEGRFHDSFLAQRNSDQSLGI